MGFRGQTVPVVEGREVQHRRKQKEGRGKYYHAELKITPVENQWVLSACRNVTEQNPGVFPPLRPTLTFLIGPSPSATHRVSLAFQTYEIQAQPMQLISCLSKSHCFNIFASPGFPFKALFSGLDTFWGEWGRSCIGAGSSEAKMLMLRRLYRNFIFHVRGSVLNVWQTRSVQLFPPDITLS